MDDDDMYDEFGNLIGGSDDEYVSEEEAEEAQSEHEEDSTEITADAPRETSQITKYENNANGLTLAARFGPDVATIIPQQQEISEPVINPEIRRKGKVEFTEEVSSDNEIADSLPAVNYSRDYMISNSMALPERIRNVAIAGGFHSGKTSFIDILVLQTHTELISDSNVKSYKPLRFMDNHKVEIDRGLSIKLSPITLLLQADNMASYMFNIIDTPGHPNFRDESSSALQGVDGIVLVLDAVEGLTFMDKDLLTEAIKMNLSVTVVINKVDRLILELRLPVVDAYFKLAHIVHEINDFIQSSEYISGYSHNTDISPLHNNVVFASSTLKFSFTLKSFTALYFDNSDLDKVDRGAFEQNLWGDAYYSTTSNKFTATSNNGHNPRAFCHFVLDPLYKIVSATLTRDAKSKKLPNILWNNFGITLPKEYLLHDSKILLSEVFQLIFPTSGSFVDAVVTHIPSPDGTTLAEDEHNLTGKVIKLIETSDGEDFLACTRILEGSLKVGDRVKVLGDNYLEDAEDYKLETVDQLFVAGGRYQFPIKQAGTGFIVLIKGISDTISKTTTIFGSDVNQEDTKQLMITNFADASVYKMAVEPKNPSELPKLLNSLRKVSKSYLSSVVKIEDSGEHTILAPGELAFDCILHDVRLYFADDLQIKVSSPMVKLGETTTETSMTKFTTSSPSGANKISIIAEPVNDKQLSKAITDGNIDLSQPIKVTSKYLRTEFGWDSLAARSVWAFGPDNLQQPNILLDDTLEDETDKKLLDTVKDSISVGFRWACNEGPLCGEPIHDTKFKILDAVISSSQVQRSGAQIIPLTRRACYSGFLSASPRLMEPYYRLYVTCTYRATQAIDRILAKRRGELWSCEPIAGTQLFNVEGKVPVIESVGLETDIRLQTQGQAMAYFQFDDYCIAPGDPLDSDCYLPDLEPVPEASISRDFVMKIRRRKGLTGEPSLQKYIDSELFEKLKSLGLV